MKIQAIAAAAALTIAFTMHSAHGLAKYMQEFPNGDVLEQKFGHPGGDTSQRTDFAKAFATAGHTWSNTLCEAKFPGSSMTNGEALGDPCCTWKKGGKPDFTVTPFTTTPTKATTCAAKGGSSATSSAAAAGKTNESEGSSSSGASAATEGGAATAGTSSQAGNATKGDSETTGSSAAAATKGSPSGSSPTATPASASPSAYPTGTPAATAPSANPTSGGGCAAKKTRKLRR